ncbi:malonic semialdehyde reductase [Uliginosibacterium sp. sgz301328]|uniref:malonic semialdehyde reductase n=1 Tax=Uliginosibacterium sp. sgz301328 TaxID=3243764 RepID=UPI00359F02BF
MSQALDDRSLDQLFRTARTYNGFNSAPLPADTAERLYELIKWGPTSMNGQPGRFVFITSDEGKQRLLPALLPGNVEKTLAAPMTVIVAYDTRFFEHLPRHFTAYDARPMFESNAALAESTAFRNSSLQGAYLMMAARSLGLSVGAMSGFDPAKVNEAFFPDGRYKVNFLCNIGVGDDTKVYPRASRFEFDEIAEVI